jgi:hypothetical protein
MGGGGGYFSGSVDPQRLAQKTREAESAAEDATFRSAVEKLLADQLSQFNSRDINGTQKIFETVKKDLASVIEGTVDLLFAGSIQKHTYVDGLSDVDGLVLFDRKDIAGKSPTELKAFLAKQLQERYGKDSVYVGNLAVTLTINGKQIQMVPAMKDGAGFKISDAKGSSWARINPQNFSKALTAANRNMDNKLVPCIKLVKAIVSGLPEQRQLTGYHTESLAINLFKNYSGEKTPREILRHFFENAGTHIRQPITDSSGQSVHVDEYLGEANSVQRRIIADSFDRIARRMKNADGAKSMDRWKEFFE